MHQFEVWAPLAKTMAIKINGSTLPMQGPDSRGWWRREVDDAGSGTDYSYLIDEDQTAYPDPRSQWQPKGVHGVSRVYDQSSFAWSDTAFQAPLLATGVIYELHAGTFTEEGTLSAAISKLDYLVDLGISHVELMPLASFAGGHGWGYDGVALYAVHQPNGGPDQLKQFVNAAHERGLAVLLDVVYNHFGPVGNYTGKFGPYLTDAHHTPWGGAVNLEEAWSHEVRRFFCDNALMWLRDFHIDGLRLDAVQTFVDRSAIHFLEQLSAEVEALGVALDRPLVLIAESDFNDPRLVTPRREGGLGIDAQWSDDFHHALFSVLNPVPPTGYYADFGSLSHLAKALEQTFVYDGIYSRYRNRVHGRPAGNTPQHRFLGYIQDHDQIGNRALGDRVHETVGIDRAKIAAAIVLLAPFVPMLFQGEEWAASSPFLYFADHEDPELARLVSAGRRREFAAFGWDPASIPDPEKTETFLRSKLKWDEVEQPDHAAILAWYRELIRLRRSSACLNDATSGNTRVEYDEEERWLRIERGCVTLLCNLGQAPNYFSIAEGAQLLLTSCPGSSLGSGAVTVPPDTVAVLSTNRPVQIPVKP